jgi:hypothetical protein
VKEGKQWIHFDAHFPGRFGRELSDRFGAAGELLFILFLCACKRSFPQGQIYYRTEDEARILLCAHFPLVDNNGKEWSFDEFWHWCGCRKVTTKSRQRGGQVVASSHWGVWEAPTSAERSRRWRAKTVTSRDALRGEVRGVRGEGESVRGGHDDAPPTDSDAPAEQGAPPPAPPRRRKIGANPRANGTNPRAANEPTAPPIPDWVPEPEPADPVHIGAALEALRAEHGWTEPEPQ